MKSRYILFATALIVCGRISAQETYENAQIAASDLNGTARYVGMGGAMEALGAELSTIGTNPAGIGLFRRSYIGISGGLQIQHDAPKSSMGHATNASFDQIGFVWNFENDPSNSINVGFNYHKSRNFNQILSAANNLHDASLNKASYMKNIAGNSRQGGFYIDRNNRGELIGYEDAASEYTANTYSQLDHLMWNHFLVQTDADGNSTAAYQTAQGYGMNRFSTGYIGQYDFHVSGSSGSRFFAGATVSIHDVHYKRSSVYQEILLDKNNQPSAQQTVNDTRRITGQGYDLKLGIILRPIERSPFRIGLYVHTPTWYDLTTSNTTTLENQYRQTAGATPGTYNPNTDNIGKYGLSQRYKFRMYTPWKFGLSLGHTVGKSLAIGATYEYADYSSVKSRINLQEIYDPWWNETYTTSDNDHAMNAHTYSMLLGVSTLKLGLEFKPLPELALRAGYNYVSPMYRKDAYKDMTINSVGTYYASSADYTNWGAINRFTCGLGFTMDHWLLDFAYQYSSQSGDFFPFATSIAYNDQVEETNYTVGTRVNNNRSNLVFTLAYRF